MLKKSLPPNEFFAPRIYQNLSLVGSSMLSLQSLLGSSEHSTVLP